MTDQAVAAIRPDAPEGRARLLERRAAGDLHAFVDGAYRRLAETPDPPLVMILLQALAQLHLGVLAAELLDRPEVAALEVDPGELRTHLARIPGGRVSWDESRPCFRANATTLLRRHPELGADESALAGALATTEAFRDATGSLHLSRGQGIERRWIGGVSDARAIRTLDLRPQLAGGELVPLVLGCPPNELVSRVLAATEAEPGVRHCPVFVIERDLAHLAAWMHVADRRALLDDPRLFLFAGPEALERYRELLLMHDELEGHAAVIANSSDDAARAAADRIAEEIREHRQAKGAALHEGLAVRQAGRREHDWADRLRPGATVVGFTSRHTTMLQYSMRDIGAAFNALGYDFRVIKEDSDHARQNTLTTMSVMRDLDPALVVLINHLRPSSPPIFGTAPVLTWVQDPTEEILSRAGGASIGPRDFLAGFYSAECVDRHGYPADHYYPLGFLPVSSQLFHDGPLPAGERDRWTCDAAYIGHLHDTPETLHDRCRELYPADLHPLLEAVRDALGEELARGAHLERRDAEALVRRVAEPGAGHPDRVLTHVAISYAYRAYDLHFRLETMRWAARWAERRGRRLRLYGRGWDRHPEFAPYAGGPVEHGEEARRAYRGARLTIQTIPSGLAHQRTFEAICAGSLVLGRYAPVNFLGLSMDAFRREHGDGRNAQRSLYEHGFRGLDRHVFDSAERFETLAEAFLDDETARRALVDELQPVVHRTFVYDAVVPKIIDFVTAALRATPAPARS